jgi:hypothetical protein
MCGLKEDKTPFDSWLFTRAIQTNRIRLLLLFFLMMIFTKLEEENMKAVSEFNNYSLSYQKACEEAGLKPPPANPIQSHYRFVDCWPVIVLKIIILVL